jgi:nucleoside-triphosphatase
MHVFLTGSARAGKSTIIRNYLSQAALSADGFITYWEPDNGGRRELYLSPYGKDSRPGAKYMLAQNIENRLVLSENIVGVFDVYGSGILDNSGRHDVIVMDELGFMESNAFVFQKAVMKRISGDIPILGVIKPMRYEFLDRISNHPKVQVREVTVENRDATLEWLIERSLRSKK